MTLTFKAKFSDGVEWSKNSKRNLTHAWRVNGPEGQGDCGGYSGSYELAVKAMNAWIARVHYEVKFKEIVQLSN